jgi:GT2 family glycosyltransferase
MTDPLVSAIIPVGPGVCRRDAPGFAWLQEAIASALHQAAPAPFAGRPREDWIEIIVAVEQAGGNDLALLDRLPVKIVASAAGAPGPSRNFAASIARGDWLAFLDADDLWDEGKTARQLAAVAEAEAACPVTGVVSVVYGNARTIDAAGHGLKPAMAWAGPAGCLATLIAENRIPLSTAMIRREAFNRVGGFDPANKIGAEDYELWLAVAAAGGRFLYVPESLASFRIHPAQLSSDSGRMAAGVAFALRSAWLRSLTHEEKGPAGAGKAYF